MLDIELAGCKKEDISLNIDNGVLVMEASKPEAQVDEQNKPSFYHQERRYGKIQRAFRLPTDCDKDNAKVSYVDGVLTISFPKLENATKKLTIA
jgi:HSP20 family protein